LDEGELRPEARGEVSLLEVESNRERKLFLDEELARSFSAALEDYFQEIASFCIKREIDYLRATTAMPFEEFVLVTLRRRGSLR
jgi:hypothetical protein